MVAGHLAMLGVRGLPDRATAITRPVLALTGDEDAPPMRRASVERLFAELCPALELASITEGGHDPMQESPPRLVALIEVFCGEARVADRRSALSDRAQSLGAAATIRARSTSIVRPSARSGYSLTKLSQSTNLLPESCSLQSRVASTLAAGASSSALANTLAISASSSTPDGKHESPTSRSSPQCPHAKRTAPNASTPHLRWSRSSSSSAGGASLEAELAAS